MRVLYLIDSIGTPGGAEQSLALLAPEFRRLGVGLDVAVLHDRRGHQDALRAAGAELFVVGGDGRVAWMRSAMRLVKARRPDLVHTTLFESDLVGRIAARCAGVPVVSSLVNETYGPDHFADPSLAAWRLRSAQLTDAATARLAVRMHAVSRTVADTMARRLRYPRARIDVVPRGRSTSDLGARTEARRLAARRMLGLGDDAVMLLAVGRQEHQKGLDLALRALPAIREEIPAAVLVVAGRQGAHTADLMALTAQLGIGEGVRFLGTRDDVADLLCAADVFVMPSRREGSPGALIEAMALEVPAVVSDIPQMREVVDGSSALLVPAEDPVSLAAAVVAAHRDGDAAMRVQRARQRFLDRFSIGGIGEEMVGFYERALEASRRRTQA